MFVNRTTYSYMSEEAGEWKKDVGGELTLKVKPDGIETIIKIPIVPNYIYLGIYLSRDLNCKEHLKQLKHKINFLINAFRSTTKASNSLKLCYNT